MSSCCGACGGQDTAPKKNQKEDQIKEALKEEISKQEIYNQERSNRKEQKLEKCS